MMTIEWQNSPWVDAAHVVEMLRMKWLVRPMGWGQGQGLRGGKGEGAGGARKGGGGVFQNKTNKH